MTDFNYLKETLLLNEHIAETARVVTSYFFFPFFVIKTVFSIVYSP